MVGPSYKEKGRLISADREREEEKADRESMERPADIKGVRPKHSL